MDLELQAERSKDVISLYTTSLLRFTNDISLILGMIREHPLHTFCVPSSISESWLAGLECQQPWAALDCTDFFSVCVSETADQTYYFHNVLIDFMTAGDAKTLFIPDDPSKCFPPCTISVFAAYTLSTLL